MTPEYYAYEYRRYQTFIRQYNPEAPIYKIACGANTDDYAWTRGVLEATHRHTLPQFHGFMDGLSFHYYTIPGTWESKGSATEFDEKEYYRTLYKAYYIDTLIKNHSAIMDQFDPDKKIGMIIDEWGTWYDPEPGTNPGFLYQQNTMRDALVAGIHLNLFNKHCNRVKMANIAQLVNVLQALILTEYDKMILTPTYHVFHMYQYHQNAKLLDSHIESSYIGLEDNYMVPSLTESVSMDKEGRIHITITNLSLSDSYEIEGVLAESTVVGAKGEILTGDMRAMNTFGNPDKVRPFEYTKYQIIDKGIRFTIPACSVLHLEVELSKKDL